MKSDSLLHLFPDMVPESIPKQFTYPFCYTPAPVTVAAARRVLEHISASEELSKAFSEGKMLGVLVVRTPDGRHGFLAGFSELAGGRSNIPYFVPPILDLLDPEGHFKKTEAEINRLGEEICRLSGSEEMRNVEKALDDAVQAKETQVTAWKRHMAESRTRREAMRKEIHASGKDGTDILETLVKESQFEKAQLKRISKACDTGIKAAEDVYNSLVSNVCEMKKRRQEMSEELQRWISGNAIVENARGEKKSIYDIFAGEGLVPPGGTGECAAPKLLNYAYSHGYKPVAMGEFWYGNIPAAARQDNRDKTGQQTGEAGQDRKLQAQEAGQEVRLHGRFYPSCKGKCGPLLGFMLQGLDVEENPLSGNGHTDRCNPAMPFASIDGIRDTSVTPEIIYEDNDILVAVKPSGMLSVPGKCGGISLYELLKKSGRDILCVHRLDMETSGVIVFAKTPQAQKELQRQFAEREVEKTYIAILDTTSKDRGNTRGNAHDQVIALRQGSFQKGDKGIIDLPLSPDYNDRPRQKADRQNGKKAVTEYEIISTGDGWAEVQFHPLTGRTHQLRVHSAHPDGLGCPIKGDRLYGSGHDANIKRLCLHALKIKLRHPSSGRLITFFSDISF